MTNKSQTTTVDTDEEVVKLPHQNILESLDIDLEDLGNSSIKMQIGKCEKNYAKALENEDEDKLKFWHDNSKKLANALLKWKQDKDANDDVAAKAKEIQDKYDAAIDTADGLLKNGDHANALNAYQEALTIKPAETYAQQKIAEINQILDDQTKLAELQNKYTQAITFADEKFKEGLLADARTAYQQAMDMFPNEQYPVDQITKIDEELNKQANANTEQQNQLETDVSQEAKRTVIGIMDDVEQRYKQNGKVTHNDLIDIIPNGKYPTEKAEWTIGNPDRHGRSITLVKTGEGEYTIKQVPAKKGMSMGTKITIGVVATGIIAGILYFAFGRKSK